MKFQLGIAACMLAGCATQPTAWDPSAAERTVDGRALAGAANVTVLRIGVEYLPPEVEPDAVPEVDRTIARAPVRRAPAPTSLVERSLVPEGRHTWALSAEDLGAIDDPLARETLRFVDDLVREDRRQTEREVRLPFLDWQPADLDLSQQLWSEETITEAQREWVHENGTSVLSRPMRRLLRRVPLVSDLELSLDDFRSSFVPMSRPYRDAHASERSLGRLSLRLHASDLQDPVEIVYIRSGIRIGTSQERGKLSINWPLSDAISLTVRARRDYFEDQSRLRADLAYRYSPTTSLRLAVGDDMEFLSTSSIYSIFEAPMDGAPGLLMYAIHVF